MIYALIENGTVSNIAVIYEGNAHEFANAVLIGDIPVQIGDAYADGVFRRDSVVLLSPLEKANTIIAELDATVLDLTYQNILLEMGV